MVNIKIHTARKTSTSASGGVVTSSSAAGTGHTHANKSTLDSLSIDDNNRICANGIALNAAHAASADIADEALKADLAAEAQHAASADNASNAQYATSAGSAQTATDADKWDGMQAADYIDQPVRTTDTPTFNGVTIKHLATPGALSGITGIGALIEMAANGAATLSIDRIIARSGLEVPTIVVREVKTVGGVMFFSPASAKVVCMGYPGDPDDSWRKQWYITVDDASGFIVNDRIRYGVWDASGTLRAGICHVAAIDGNTLTVDSWRQTDGTKFPDGVTYPHAGDTIVVCGSAIPGRQSVMTMSTETGAEGLRIYDGITGGVLRSSLLKLALGNLSGINDTQFPGMTGWGLWSNSAYLRGQLTARRVHCTDNEGNKVMTLNDEGDNALTSYLPDGRRVRYGYARINEIDTVAQCYDADDNLLWVTPADGGANTLPTWRRLPGFTYNDPVGYVRVDSDDTVWPWILGGQDSTDIFSGTLYDLARSTRYSGTIVSCGCEPRNENGDPWEEGDGDKHAFRQVVTYVEGRMTRLAYEDRGVPPTSYWSV